MLCEECRECPSREKTMSKKTSLKDRKHGDGDKGDEIDRPSIGERKMSDWHWHEHNAIGIDIFQQGVLQSTLETIELWRKRFDARGN